MITQSIIDTIHPNPAAEDSYYIADDGLKYCPICNDPLEVILHPRNKPEIKLPSICLCTEKRIEEGRRQKYLLLKNAIFGEESDVEILELSGGGGSGE